MRNYILLIILAIVFVTCKQSEFIKPTNSCVVSTDLILATNHPKKSELIALMDEYIKKGIPGVTVLIKDNDGVLVQSMGFADIENNIPMQPCHINKLGSITKMMIGTLVWQLVQENKINIDAPISTYIPNIASKITNGDQITTAMLLNHTAGVYDIARDLGFNLAVVDDFTKPWTSEQVLKYIVNKPATHLPGAKVSYSNSHTLLVGLIIEAITGMPHGEFLKQRIFDPLNMNNTVYYDYSNSFPKNHLAQGYLDFNNDGGSIQNISNLNPGSGNAYTGVYSTVFDLYKFMDALMVQQSFTTPENLDFILSNMKETDTKEWKSSVGSIHREFMDILPDSIIAYGHGGGDIGYSANLNYLPHNQTIFAATFNYGTNLPSPLGNVLKEFRQKLILLAAK
jgi:D-alanyl-D-alanine carboxypeptidase